MVSAKPSQMHLHFIRTTPDALWDALTDGDRTRLFYHGLVVESDFRAGAPIRYLREDEAGNPVVVIEGEVVEVDAARRLVHTFAFTDSDDAPTRVAYDVEPMGEVVKLTMTHDGFDGKTDTYHTTLTGWCPIFSGLKTLLETGEPLVIPAPAEDAPAA